MGILGGTVGAFDYTKGIQKNSAKEIQHEQTKALIHHPGIIGHVLVGYLSLDGFNKVSHLADQLTQPTKLAIWGFFLINGACFIVILFNFYKKIDDFDRK